MKLNLISPMVAVVFAFVAPNVQAQDAGDDVLLRAMKDEITRNINELKLPDLEKPFFLMYGVVDQKTYTTGASLGSLIRINVTPERLRSTVRVMVGDYQFNDESLEDNLFSAPAAYDVSIPLENDYVGIRRSFWKTTDDVYRSAARHFQRNQEALKETGKKLDDIPHRSFGKGTSVTLINPSTAYAFDSKKWEAKTKKLSELFLKYPFIRTSVVAMNYIEGNRYLVNTEGVTVKTPFSFAMLFISGTFKSDDGGQTSRIITFNAKTPDLLPSDEQLTAEIESLTTTLRDQSKLPKFDEEYSGPVLFVGQSVAEVFASGLLSGGENIMASDNITKLNGGFQFDMETTADHKLGKNLVSEMISVSAKPKLKTFNGTELLGSYEVDNEGIVPENEVKVIDHGILKELLNNRTITNRAQKANGFSTGPGVLEITMAAKDSEKSLMKKLIDEAKKQKLEYAMIVRSRPGESGMRMAEISKVYVKTGKVEQVREAAISRLGVKSLKRLLGATNSYQAYNLGNFSGTLLGRGAGLTSFIVPQQILIDDVDVTPARMPVFKEEDYVKNPLIE